MSGCLPILHAKQRSMSLLIGSFNSSLGNFLLISFSCVVFMLNGTSISLSTIMKHTFLFYISYTIFICRHSIQQTALFCRYISSKIGMISFDIFYSLSKAEPMLNFQLPPMSSCVEKMQMDIFVVYSEVNLYSGKSVYLSNRENRSKSAK